MDRNLFIAIIVSIVIIVGFQYFFQVYSPPSPKKQPSKTEAPKKDQPPSVKQPESTKEQAVPTDKPTPASRAVTSVPTTAAPAKEVRITVATPKYEAVVSSLGARIVSFRLKQYKQTLKGVELVNLFPPGGPDTSGPSIIFTRRDERFDDTRLPYHCASSETRVELRENGSKKSVTFTMVTDDGLFIDKTFTFDSTSYDVDFSLTLTNKSQETRNYLITFPWKKFFNPNDQDRFAWDSAEILLNDELKDYYFNKIKGEEEPSGRVEWAGLGSVYFFKALVFGSNPATKVTLFKPTPEGVAEIRIRYGALDLKPGQSVSRPLSLYLGPKEQKALEEAGHDLSKALYYSEYRILDIMSRYLMKFLQFCNSGFTVAGIKIPGTHNYGIDIILLTIVIKILFIPLTHTSMKSMKKMQDLQPQLQKLKEKYKDDKQELNKATMELFREHKVSPLGSCWPMFLQLPVFIALYQALAYAIELRHAPFLCIPSIYLCINDLSAPDPYYVTPVLMGASMILQQWMTPSTGDPTQRKMMLLMPVVFTYFFLNLPSGLVLYWFVSNLLSIGQQLVSNSMTR